MSEVDTIERARCVAAGSRLSSVADMQRGVLSLAMTAAWFCPGAIAQQTWIVDRFNRAGTHFTDLPAAVAAASSGDTLQVRATSNLVLDQYEAPTIQGKALRIVGETTPLRTTVLGTWTIQGVPANQVLVLKGLQIAGATAVAFPPQGRFLTFVCSANAGAVVLEDMTTDPFLSTNSPARFQDCNLVCIQRSSLPWCGPWEAIRSNLMLSDSLLQGLNQNITGNFAPSALSATDSRVILANTRLIGASVINPSTPFANGYAIEVCGSQVTVGSGSVLQAGQYYGGGYGSATIVAGTGNCSRASIIAVEWPGPAVVGSLAGSFQITYDYGPETGMRCTQSPTTLRIDQHGYAQSLTAFAIGSVTTSPWTYLVGPVFVDPVGSIDFFDYAPATGVVTRTLSIPPALPPGFTVCLQGFELMTTGRLMTSNAIIAGLW